MKNIVLLLLLLPSVLIGQGIDMDRMNRDIKVAENGLKTLIQSNNGSNYSASDNFFSLNSRNVDGQYIKDYGVIFTAEICEPCFKNKSKNKNTEGDISIVNVLVTAAETFLADYGSIIGQLKSDQKIMIRFSDEGDNHNRFARKMEIKGAKGDITSAWVTGNQNMGHDSSQEITVEVASADIASHMSGSISRAALIGKMKTESKVISHEADPQLETFSAMFHRLYQKDLSSTYFMSSRPEYSKIKGVGTMFKARVYSSNVYDKERYSIPTIGKSDLSLEDRNAIVVDMLPEFEKIFKENIISYARTIRDMDKSETIMFEVRMTECKGCNEFPKYMIFSVKQEILDQFNKGKLSFDQAVSKINVENRGA